MSTDTQLDGGASPLGGDRGEIVAGRELDAEVASRVLGIRVSRDSHGNALQFYGGEYPHGFYAQPKPYSSPFLGHHAMTSTTELYDTLKARRDELEKELGETAKAVFRETAEELFAAHPLLQAFGWTQYTPYFNDGDTCVFSANTDDPYIAVDANENPNDGDTPYQAVSEDDEQSYGGTWDKVDGKYQRVAPRNAYERAGEAVLEFLKRFDEDAMEEMFGDHVKVMVRRSGVDVDQYEHD